MGTTLIEEPGRPKPKGTTLVGAPAGGTRLAAPVADASSSAGSSATGPVVGWLVVVEGPGRGRSLQLGYGMNIIGRGPGNRVVLDFGDDQISQDDHFRIAYDRENRKFHLVPGRGTNLVYVNGTPLLSPMELRGNDDLKVGSSVIRFVPFCSTEWDWPEQPAG
jgi:hypothetical protein